MTPMIFAVSLALPLTLVFTSLSAFGQASPSVFQVFDASEHQKSQAARLTVTYPAGFIARESARQRVVQSFTGSSDGVDVAMTLGIEAGDEDIEAYCASRTSDDWRKSFESPNMEVLNVQIVRWKNRPAVLMTTARFIKLDGFPIHSRVQTLSLCHKRHRVSLTCGTSGNSVANSAALMQQATPTCERFYNSLYFKT